MLLRIPFQIQIKRFAWLACAISIVCISVAYADDPDAMVRFNCDTRNNYLLIEEFFEQMGSDTPYPRVIDPDATIISMRGLMWVTESSSGTYTWNHKDISRTCRLGKNTYVATLSAELICRGGCPVLSLTIHRNGDLVAKNLVFNNMCRPSPNRIKQIRFESKTNLAFITVLNTNTQSEKELRISTAKPISRERLFGLE